MSVCLQFSDDIVLVTTIIDEYQTETVDEEHSMKAAVDLNTGYSHSNNQDAITSDAVMFLPPSDEFVTNNFYRLEEMLVKIPLFGTSLTEAWYKITSVTVARDTQLCNEPDHLEVHLKKTVEPNAS